MDETFVGGKPRYRGGERPRDEYGRFKRGPRPGFQDKKRPVVGMVERNGRVRAWATNDRRTSTIRPLVEAHVMPETMVFTDEAKQYDLLPRYGYPHKRVTHSAKVYVDGVYIQTINMRTKSSTARVVAFTRAFPGGGVHRIKVVVVGLDPARLFRLDAFVVSK
jgi:transposase-like protein